MPQQITTRIASRLDLLRECHEAGIRRCGLPAEVSCDPPPKVEYEVPNLDLNAIFARRDTKQLPWGGNKRQQEKWGKGIQTVLGTLQAILDYNRVHGHVPNPDRQWSLRCSDPHGSRYSLSVDWDPAGGLFVGYVRHDDSGEDGGALPQEEPALGTRHSVTWSFCPPWVGLDL